MATIDKYRDRIIEFARALKEDKVSKSDLEIIYREMFQLLCQCSVYDDYTSADALEDLLAQVVGREAIKAAVNVLINTDYDKVFAHKTPEQSKDIYQRELIMLITAYKNGTVLSKEEIINSIID